MCIETCADFCDVLYQAFNQATQHLAQTRGRETFVATSGQVVVACPWFMIYRVMMEKCEGGNGRRC